MISRSIGGGVHEDLDITNYSQKPVRFNLEIALRSDFADIFEVKANHIVRRGRITTSWDGQTQRLDTSYRNQDFRRELIVQADRCGSPAVLRQRPHQLRGRARARRRLARLPALRAGRTARATSRRPTTAPRWRRTRTRAARARIGHAERADRRDRQRGVQQPLPPGDRRHGGAAPAGSRGTDRMSSSPPPACPGSSPCSAATA